MGEMKSKSIKYYVSKGIQEFEWCQKKISKFQRFSSYIYAKTN